MGPMYQGKVMQFKDEKVSIGIFLAIISTLTTIDVVEDLVEGTTFTHVAMDLAIAILAIGAFLYLVMRIVKKRKLILQMESEKKIYEDIAKQHQSNSKLLIHGLEKYIDQEFINWSLSPSEREICLLILKGLSNAEIANIRGSSESTVRHQTSSIYKKSDLKNRQDLMSYFLEELLDTSELSQRITSNE